MEWKKSLPFPYVESIQMAVLQIDGGYSSSYNYCLLKLNK